MTRRPASRRPPRLPDRERELGRRADAGTPVPPREQGPRELLKRNRVSGCAHPRFGRDEVRSRARRVVADDPNYAHGIDVGDIEIDDVYAALARNWGCTLDDPRARLDVDRTIVQLDRATARIADVAGSGGRVIFATCRPASLLPLHLALARDAAARGARILREREVGAVRAAGRPDRSVWWLEGIAVVTDGASVLAHDDSALWPEIDFATGRAELVVTDGALAAGALAAGFEVVSFADLDLMVLGVAADRGRPVTIVPLVGSRPAWCYEPLLTLASQGAHSTPPAR